MALADRVSWVLNGPRETYEEFLLPPIAPRAWGLVFLGAIVSAAVADATIVPALAPRLLSTVLSFAFAFGLAVLLFFELSRWFGAHTASWTSWLQCASVAMVPAYLLLPIALLSHPMGWSGFVFYELCKAVIAVAMLRRTVWAIEALNRWPSWASALLLIGPMALTFAMMMGLVMIGVLLLGVSLWRL